MMLLVCLLTVRGGTFYTADDVLSNSLINDIFQDSRNYIWIATEDGLNKYDGVRFTVYKNKPGDPATIKNNYIRTVFEDSQGRFWIGCINGLMLYDRAKDRFSEVPVYFGLQRIEPHITSIIETREGEIWIATSSDGVIRSNKNYQSFHVDVKLFSQLSSQYLIAIHQDYQGNIWLASEYQGLNRYSPKTGKMDTFKAPEAIGSNQISSICEDQDHQLYVGTLSAGLFCFDAEKNKFDPIPYLDTDLILPVKSLYCDTKNQVLVGTDGRGMMLYNKDKNYLEEYKMLSASFDFSRAKVHAICQDQLGNLWVGLFQKGAYLALNYMNTFSYWGSRSYYHNVIGSNCVMSVLKDKQDLLWVGTDNDGLYSIDKMGKSTHYELRSSVTGVSSTIMAMEDDGNHTLWLASFLDGLIQFDKRTGKINRFRHQNHTAYNAALSNKAMAIAKDNKNNIWVGTNGAGVMLFDTARKEFVKQYFYRDQDSTGIANNWVNCLLNDGDSLIWVGTYGGVSRIRLKDDQIQSFKVKDGVLPGNIVYAINKDNSGNLWFGTTEGLACYDPKTNRSAFYTMEDGLPSNVVCGILQDEDGNIWISTYTGISKLLTKEKRFVNHYANDGLQGNEFSIGAAFKAYDGEFLFGGVGGVNTFYPSAITDQLVSMDVYLTGLYVLDKPVFSGQKSNGRPIINDFIMDENQIELSYFDNMFSLEFSTFDFGNLNRVSYRYMLEGLNTQWVSTESGTHRISFTNLNYGRYKLRIKATIHDNESAEKVFNIIIHPPWYWSNWAKFMYVMLFITLMWMVWKIILDRLRQKQELLRRQHAEQLSEAKLQFFINVSHEIRTPMSLIISPLEKLITNKSNKEDHKVYQLMYRNAQRILRLINQLLDVRKLDKGLMAMKFRETDIVGFIDDVMQTFEYQANKQKVNFTFCHTDAQLNAWIDLSAFDKVLVNILSNAFKFTPENGAIEVSLRTGENYEKTGPLRNYFEVKIADTGTGIAEDQSEKIFERFYQIDNSLSNANIGTGVGLHLSRSLIELQHGVLFARRRSDDQQGSEFIIRMPLGSEHIADQIDFTKKDLVFPKPRIPVQPLGSEEEQTTKIKSKTKYRVLIVEDEGEIREYLKNELLSLYKIFEAPNGKLALDFILQEKPDLIISDVMMPEMDGITLSKKIKSNVHVNHIPIILLTAKVTDKNKVEGFEAGADAYVSKPFNVDLLKSVIAGLLENRERLGTKLSMLEENKDLIKPIVIKSSDQVLYEKVIKIINENIDDPELNVEFLANGVGMSRVHMHRKLKELTNQSARDFIKTIRMNHAAELLSGKKLSVSDVAYALGFNNLSYFSNTFREFYGMSPTEYASQKRREE